MVGACPEAGGVIGGKSKFSDGNDGVENDPERGACNRLPCISALCEPPNNDDILDCCETSTKKIFFQQQQQKTFV